jgi:hypothetical protein
MPPGAVRCDFAAQVCSLDMIVADHDADSASRRRFQRSGNIYGVTRYEDLVTGTGQRGRWVTQEFHNKGGRPDRIPREDHPAALRQARRARPQASARRAAETLRRKNSE